MPYFDKSKYEQAVKDVAARIRAENGIPDPDVEPTPRGVWTPIADDELTAPETDAAHLAVSGIHEWGGSQATITYTGKSDGHLIADVTVFQDDANGQFYAVARRELPAGPETVIARLD